MLGKPNHPPDATHSFPAILKDRRRSYKKEEKGVGGRRRGEKGVRREEIDNKLIRMDWLGRIGWMGILCLESANSTFSNVGWMYGY